MPNAEKETQARVKFPIATTARWEQLNPVLLEGEVGFELTASGAIFAKVGDGETAWGSLPYFSAHSAKQLATARNIDGIEFNGTSDISHFVVCDTSAEVSEKVVSCEGFRKRPGAWIIVKFSVTNTADSTTLNVNNTGAAPIYYQGSAIGKSQLAAGRFRMFIYDGTNYEFVGDVNTTHNTFSGATENTNGAKGLVPQPVAGDQKRVLFGNATWGDIPVMTGATDVAPGTSGAVPQPQAGDETKFLRGDGTYATPSGSGSGSGGASNFAQVTKMNVTASSASPKTVDITMPSSRTFFYATPNVLKFESTQTGVLVTACNFNNGDATDFVYNADYVTFDGYMKLKTEYSINVGTPAALGSGYLASSAEIDMSNYKTVESIDVGGESTVTLTMTATGGGKGTWTHRIDSSAAVLKTSAGAIYDFAGNKLADDWDALSSSQKEAAFASATGDNPLIAAAALGTFRFLIFGSTSTKPSCTITAVPPDQVIKPKGLMNLSAYETIQNVNVTDSKSGNAASKQAVTPDLTNYYSYDSVNEEWVQVTPTAAGILENGMTSTEIADVPAEAWAELTGDNEQVGFAYALSATNPSETLYVDCITLTVDMKGIWVSAVLGTDYIFAYISNTVLRFTIYESGSYKINYDAG